MPQIVSFTGWVTFSVIGTSVLLSTGTRSFWWLGGWDNSNRDSPVKRTRFQSRMDQMIRVFANFTRFCLLADVGLVGNRGSATSGGDTVTESSARQTWKPGYATHSVSEPISSWIGVTSAPASPPWFWQHTHRRPLCSVLEVLQRFSVAIDAVLLLKALITFFRSFLVCTWVISPLAAG